MKLYRVSFECVPESGDAVAVFPGGHYRPVPLSTIPTEWWRPVARETHDGASAISQVTQLAAWAASEEQPIRNVKLEVSDPTWEVIPVSAPSPAPDWGKEGTDGK